MEILLIVVVVAAPVRGRWPPGATGGALGAIEVDYRNR